MHDTCQSIFLRSGVTLERNDLNCLLPTVNPEEVNIITTKEEEGGEQAKGG